MNPPLTVTCQVRCSLLRLNLPLPLQAAGAMHHSLLAALSVLPSRCTFSWWACRMSRCSHPDPNLTLSLDPARGVSSQLPRAILAHLWSVSTQQGVLTIKHINQATTPPRWFCAEVKSKPNLLHLAALCSAPSPLTPSHAVTLLVSDLCPILQEAFPATGYRGPPPCDWRSRHPAPLASWHVHKLTFLFIYRFAW